ncbi:hypothetical protein QM565_00510, partial [Geitlerinema splendidum]|nr:hypothetical protein [Geitlerinema splendidum]
GVGEEEDGGWGDGGKEGANAQVLNSVPTQHSALSTQHSVPTQHSALYTQHSLPTQHAVTHCVALSLFHVSRTMYLN